MAKAVEAGSVVYLRGVTVLLQASLALLDHGGQQVLGLRLPALPIQHSEQHLMVDEDVLALDVYDGVLDLMHLRLDPLDCVHHHFLGLLAVHLGEEPVELAAA